MSKNIAFLLAISPDDGQAHFWRSVRTASVVAKMEDTQVAVYLPENERARAAVEKFQKSDDAPLTFHFLEDMTPPPQGNIHFTPFHPYVLNNILNSPDVLVIDTYRAMDATILRHAKNVAGHVILIDDYDIKNIRGGNADTVLNVTLPGISIQYGPKTTRLTAPDYHMIQPEMFSDRIVKPDTVLVSFSTADHGRVATSFLNSMKKTDPKLGGSKYNYTVFVKELDPKFKPAMNDLCEIYKGRFKVINDYTSDMVPGAYAIHIGNPGAVTNDFICAQNSKVAGIGALTEISPHLISAFKDYGIPFADLTGILDGRNRKAEMDLFAQDVAKCLRQAGGVSVPRPNRNGLRNFANYIVSKCG